MWHLPDRIEGITPDYFRARHEVLKRRCEETGRDPAEIEPCIQTAVVVDEEEAAARRRFQAPAVIRHWTEQTAPRHAIAGTPAQVTEAIKAWEAAGVDHLMVALVPGINYDDLELFAEAVLPDLRSKSLAAIVDHPNGA